MNNGTNNIVWKCSYVDYHIYVCCYIGAHRLVIHGMRMARIFGFLMKIAKTFHHRKYVQIHGGTVMKLTIGRLLMTYTLNAVNFRRYDNNLYDNLIYIFVWNVKLIITRFVFTLVDCNASSNCAYDGFCNFNNHNSGFCEYCSQLGNCEGFITEKGAEECNATCVG